MNKENKPKLSKKRKMLIIILIVSCIFVLILFFTTFFDNINSVSSDDNIEEIEELSKPNSDLYKDVINAVQNIENSKEIIGKEATVEIDVQKFMGMRNMQVGTFYDVELIIADDSKEFCSFTKDQNKSYDFMMKMKNNIENVTDQVDNISLICTK